VKLRGNECLAAEIDPRKFRAFKFGTQEEIKLDTPLEDENMQDEKLELRLVDHRSQFFIFRVFDQFGGNADLSCQIDDSVEDLLLQSGCDKEHQQILHAPTGHYLDVTKQIRDYAHLRGATLQIVEINE
jgi:hypothetical protein